MEKFNNTRSTKISIKLGGRMKELAMLETNQFEVAQPFGMYVTF